MYFKLLENIKIKVNSKKNYYVHNDEYKSVYERLFNIVNNYNGYDVYDGESYISIHSDIYTPPPPYYQSIFCENRKYICNLARFYIPQKSIKIINNKKRRQGRYMDMGHYQRREV